MNFKESKQYKDTMAKAALIKDPVDRALFWLEECSKLLESLAPVEVVRVKEDELDYQLTDEELLEKN